ncbi:MAG: hypothetical protein UV71_C0007G0022 [Microgenomates group bacterium GW2011_GWC1_43_13]|nr:MAG: hypothetical protein UV71_C0007G0022 [Microgenomates group bacterium GW2011_GWC1_43_13]OGM82331.1 MAG: hypothetical protein A2394_01900 [Candidatus Woesebacteria bacterium RIFOXYB1_FULL_42_36]
MKERGAFEKARIDGILNALSEGKTGYDELSEAGKTSESRAIEDIGLESERRFTRYARQVDFIECVQDAVPYEDAYEGVDKWLRFKPYKKLPDLPVQVKSSFRDVNLFRKNPKYKNRGGMEIVINCGPSINYGIFLRQLTLEVNRIKISLEESPSLGRFIV